MILVFVADDLDHLDDRDHDVLFFSFVFLVQLWLMHALHYCTCAGQIVAELRTKKGECDVMRQNPRNAVLGLGHSNGYMYAMLSESFPALARSLARGLYG
jgi:hypothetical protein